MTKNNSYISIVAHQIGLKKITVSYTSFGLVAVFCLVGVLGLLYATFQYVKMYRRVADYDKLYKENTQVKLENQSYKLLTEQMGEKLSSLEITSKKLSIISGLEPLKPSQGGTGGPSANRLLSASSQRNPPLGPLRQLTKRVPELEATYHKLNDFYKDQFLLNVHTPSIWPVRGYVSRGFGPQANPLSDSDHHAGIDISAPYANKIVAPAAGVVIFAGFKPDYGNLVVLNHKLGVTTLYAHLSRIRVNVGQRVRRYDVLGLVGSTGRSTGPHLHYEVRVNNRLVNPFKFIKDPR